MQCSAQAGQALTTGPRKTRSDFTFLCLLALLVGLGGLPWQQVSRARDITLSQPGSSFAISADGRAACPIVIAEGADEAIREHAQTLADYLHRITGSRFEIQTGDGSSGIALGVAGDFKLANVPAELASADPLTREQYLMRSHAQGVLLIGATPLAVRHAVWDLLGQLGYRQFFPGATWEVVPKPAAATLQADRLESPDFHTRWVWYGFGLWKDINTQAYEDWCVRNRAVPGFRLRTGHCYDTIIRRNKAVFEAHPEYLGLVDGKRQGSKFCIANADLRRLVVERYALAHFQENPDSDSVSLEPSDGGGWCECEDCAKMGSVSDRVVILANEAAVAIRHAYPGKYVGLLAYNEHCAPPSIRVEPEVIVKVQTSFIRGGLTFEQIVTGWQAQGARVGMGDYYSIFQSDQSRPARQKGSDLPAIAQGLRRAHELGARFFMSESSDLWGAIGLGHYLAGKVAWDVSLADDIPAIERDFFDKAFGQASGPMEAYFRLIYRTRPGDRRPLVRRDMLARMYRHLQQAVELAGEDQAILGRIHDLALFTRYEALFQAYEESTGQARQTAAEAVLTHAWKIRHTMMVHGKPLTANGGRRLISRDRQLKPLPEDFTWPDELYTSQEISRIIQEGVASTELVEIGFDPVDFSEELVPAAPLRLAPTPADKLGQYNRVAPMGRQRFYTWLDQPGRISLQISGGHIVHYRNIASPVQTTLYASANPIPGEAVAHDRSVPPDGTEVIVNLESSFEGLHEVEVFPPSNRAMVAPAEAGLPWVMAATLDDANQLSSVWEMYFYVPRGTTVVGGFASRNRGWVLDGDGKRVFDLTKGFEAPGFFSVPVPPGQDGKLWRLERIIGKVSLLTVPPYLARSAQELLLPREVVEADRAD